MAATLSGRSATSPSPEPVCQGGRLLLHAAAIGQHEVRSGKERDEWRECERLE
jgi:hypothetical protein